MKDPISRTLGAFAACFTLAIGVFIPAVPHVAAQATRPVPLNESFTRTIEDGGTGPYKAVLAGDPSLPTHTIFRPNDLSIFGDKQKLPIVAWGNGGCANSTEAVVNYLSEIASHGYLVIGIGPAQAEPAAARRGGAPGGTTRSSQLLDAIEWATRENANQSSIYHGKIDVSKIAVIGTSCGGLQAIEVSPDPRITTTIVANSGILNSAPASTGATTAPARGGGLPGMPPLTKEYLTKLHAPILYILGGASDMATANGSDDFRRIEKIPAYFASSDVGHGGTFARPHGGEFAVVTIAWLQWQLKGESESAKMFIGEPSGLSKRPGWTLEKKNLP